MTPSTCDCDCDVWFACICTHVPCMYLHSHGHCVGKACERGSSQSDHVPHLPSSRRLTTSHFNQTMASPGAGISLPPQDKWPSPDAGAAPLSDPDIREPSNGAHLNDDGRSAPPLDSAGDYHSDVPPPDSHKPFREKQVKVLSSSGSPSFVSFGNSVFGECIPWASSSTTIFFAYHSTSSRA